MQIKVWFHHIRTGKPVSLQQRCVLRSHLLPCSAARPPKHPATTKPHLDVGGACDAQRCQGSHHLLAGAQLLPAFAGEESARVGVAGVHHRNLRLLFFPWPLQLLLLLPLGPASIPLLPSPRPRPGPAAKTADTPAAVAVWATVGPLLLLLLPRSGPAIIPAMYGRMEVCKAAGLHSRAHALTNEQQKAAEGRRVAPTAGVTGSHPAACSMLWASRRPCRCAGLWWGGSGGAQRLSTWFPLPACFTPGRQLPPSCVWRAVDCNSGAALCGSVVQKAAPLLCSCCGLYSREHLAALACFLNSCAPDQHT